MNKKILVCVLSLILGCSIAINITTTSVNDRQYKLILRQDTIIKKQDRLIFVYDSIFCKYLNLNNNDKDIISRQK